MNLFVFGTLKQGYPANDKLRGATYLGPAISSARFKMVDVGYPMIIPHDEGHLVRGEMYDITESHLAVCDRYEGYPHHYNRQEQEFHMVLSSGRYDAWVYFNHHLPVQAMKVLPNSEGLLEWFPARHSTE